MKNRLKTYFSRFRVRDGIGLVVLSLIIATLGVVGTSYITGEGYYAYSGTDTLLYIGGWALVFAAATLLIDIAYEFVLPRRHIVNARRSEQHRIHRILARITPHWSMKSILFFALIMFLLWLPYAVIDFPDSLYYDTYYQIRQSYPEYHPTSILPFDKHTTAATLTDAYFTDHHPLFDTLLYSAFGQASYALTGRWSMGIFIFVLLQGFGTALCFSMATAYLRKRGCPLALCVVLFAFFCLMPFYALWATAMMKDSLFCMIFIPYFIMLAELTRTRGENLRRGRTVVGFIVLGIFLCLTKKTGMYIVVPTALIAAIMYRKHWLPLIGQAASCLIVMLLVLPYAVFPLLNVASGGKQEMLSPLFQQTAKYYIDNYDDITALEWAAIGKIIPTDIINEAYIWHTHDPIKFKIKQNATAEDYEAYFRVWATHALRHPETYLSALMGAGGSYLGFDGHTSVRLVDTEFGLNLSEFLSVVGQKSSAAEDGESDELGSYSFELPGSDTPVKVISVKLELLRDMAKQPEFLADARHFVEKAYDKVSMLPGIIVMFTDATYLLWLPAVALFVAWRRKLPMKLLLIPFAITLFFCVIGPTASTRYALSSIYTAPLLMGVIATFVRAQWMLFRPRVTWVKKRPLPQDQSSPSRTHAPQPE